MPVAKLEANDVLPTAPLPIKIILRFGEVMATKPVDQWTSCGQAGSAELKGGGFVFFFFLSC
jgi:hypothetical protein